MDQCLRASIAGSLCDSARALRHYGIEIPVKSSHQIHHRIGTLNHCGNAGGMRYTAWQELDLAKIGERLQRIGLFRITAGNPQPRAPLQQGLRNMVADKTTTANQGYKLTEKGITRCHGSNRQTL